MKINKTFAFILIFVSFFLVGCLNSCQHEITDNDNGKYPQTLVKDVNLKNALIELIKTQAPDAKGYYTYNNEQYYPYSGVSYTDNDGNEVSSGTHFYKVEPIKWKILSSENDQVFVTSEYLLDAHRYDASSNNYENSEIRNWLNNDFINRAFNSTDNIAVTAVDNSVASTGYTTNPYVCPTTNDKIFLLSYSELHNANYGFTNDDSRMCITTEFARARGAYYSESESYINNGFYWTSSPTYYLSYGVRCVSYGGFINSSGDGLVIGTRYAVRPALRFTF